MNAPVAKPDPSRSSHYVNDALYRALIENFSNWQDDARAVTDVAVRDEFRRLIEREARLLDQLRYDDWLAMYAAECIYWVPSTPERRRSAARDFGDVRRPPPARGSDLPDAHRIRLVAGAGIAHRAARHQRRSFRHRARRYAHGALEFLDQRILGRRDQSAHRLGGHRVVRDGPAGRSRPSKST